MEFSALLIWCESVVILWVWWSCCTYRAVNWFTWTSGMWLLGISDVCRREENRVLLMHATSSGDSACAQYSRLSQCWCDGGFWRVIYCLKYSTDKTSQARSKHFFCFEWIQNFLLVWGFRMTPVFFRITAFQHKELEERHDLKRSSLTNFVTASPNYAMSSALLEWATCDLVPKDERFVYYW